MENLIKAIEAEISARYVMEYDPKDHAPALRLVGREHAYKGTLEQQKKKYAQALRSQKTRALARAFAKIEEAQRTPREFIKPVIVSVIWTKNRTWGYTARGVDNYGNRSDVASGCGYCKRSTAMAGVLNENARIMRRLYETEDARLAGAEANKGRREGLGYGSGHGVLPSFKGGCGVGTLVDLLKKIGLSVVDEGDILVIQEAPNAF